MGGGRIVPSLPSFHDPVFGFHVEEVWGRAASYWGSGGWRVWMWIAWMQGHVLM